MKSIKKIGKNKYRIYSPYDRDLLDKLRQLPQRKYNGVNKTWEVTIKPNSYSSCFSFLDLLTNFEWELIDCENEILEMIDFVEKREGQVKENKSLSVAMISDFEIKGLNYNLYPFQKAGVEYLVKNKRVILGDQMGLGKTIEALSAIHYVQAYPCLIVCPNTLKLNWKKELEKWIPNIKVEILESSSNIESFLKLGFHIIISNYQAATKYKKELGKVKLKAIIVDESHLLKSKKAQRTKAIKDLSKVSSLEYFFELTGTIAVSRPRELVSQLDIINAIDEFGGEWKFLMRYCGAKKDYFGWDFSGASNLDELHNKLRTFCYIRRETSQVIKELPPFVTSEVFLTISNKKEYIKAEKDLLLFLKNKEYDEEAIKQWFYSHYKMDWEIISKEQKSNVKKEYIEEKVDKASSAEHLVKINILRQLSANGKIDGVIEWVENFLESGEKLVLFGIHIEPIKKIAEHFSVVPIIGETSIEDRQRIVDDFQKNERTKLIILNINLGGVGITLTSAFHLAFIEVGWTPSEMDQAIARIHRIGQGMVSMIYYLLAKDTIDEDIFELVNDKRIITDAVNKGLDGKKDIKILNELIKRLRNS